MTTAQATYQKALADFNAATAGATLAQRKAAKPGRGLRARTFACRYVKPEEDQALYTQIYNIFWNYFDV